MAQLFTPKSSVSSPRAAASALPLSSFSRPLLAILLFVLLTIHLALTLTDATYPFRQRLAREVPCPVITSVAPPSLQPSHPIRTLDDVRAFVPTIRNDLAYAPEADLLIMTMAKAGTSTIWQLLYRGITNERWINANCGIVHNKSHACWSNRLKPFHTLSETLQLDLLTNDHTLRMAIQREPFDRLMSAYKSKLTCEPERFHVIIKARQMHTLRTHANLPPGRDCMNMSEFGTVLERVRLHAGEPGFARTVYSIDEHFRPQQFYFDRIDYHLVLNTRDMSDDNKMAPLYRHLPYPERAKEDTHKHSTGSELIVMDEHVASQIHSFASLSVYGAVKYPES